jgi:predicted ATPase
MAYLAFALWPLGEIDRAAALIARMLARMASLDQVFTLGVGSMYAAQFALMRGDPAKGKEHSTKLTQLARQNDHAQFRAFGEFFKGCAKIGSDLPLALSDMRHGTEELRAQKVVVFDGLVKIALAKAETDAGQSDRALSILDEALDTAQRLDYRAFEAELHRSRGEILLQSSSPDPTMAEESLRIAIDIAQRQRTRSFGLRAALALAKLYQSTSRRADAHAVLAPALEGFSLTPEMPEIAEAQALLERLKGGSDGAIPAKDPATKG